MEGWLAIRDEAAGCGTGLSLRLEPGSRLLTVLSPHTLKAPFVLNPAGASVYTIDMRMRLFVSLVVVLCRSHHLVLPPTSSRLPSFQKGGGPPPAITPEDPSQSGGPAIPPSKMDPGIERRPSGIPDPRSAVSPPNVDPKMSVNPATAPPAKDALKPRKGEEPQDKRPSR